MGEWNKLVRIGNSACRIVSVKGTMLAELGFKREDELEAKLTVEDGAIVMKVRKRGE